MSGYVIDTRRVETWKFPYTFRFAANNVRYTSAWSVNLRLSFRVFLKTVFSTVVRIVSLGVLVPKFHGTRRIDLYSRTRFSTVLLESLSIQKPEIPRYLKSRLCFRLRFSTVRKFPLGILDPHYILCFFLENYQIPPVICTLLLMYSSTEVACALIILDSPSLLTIYKHIFHN